MVMSIMTVLFLALCASGLGAQGFVDDDYLIPVDHRMGLPGLEPFSYVYPADYFPLYGVFYGDYLFLESNQSDLPNSVLTYSDGIIAEDGYRYYMTGISSSYDPTIIVSGGDSLIVVERCIYEKPDEHITGKDTNGSGVFFGGPERFKKNIMKEWDSYYQGWGEFRPGVWEDGIESIVAWSTLTETVKGEIVEYGVDRLRYPFYSFIDAELCFNNAMLFWAEGEPGSGIGGTIHVAFNRSSDHVMILNGAVDFARLNLYKDNNRAKRVLVRADDGSFAFEHVFEDVVAFHKIPFPSEARGVTITILEVYRGRRWDDTCITAIYLKQPPLRPRYEYESTIDAYLRLKGIDRLIEEYERRHGGAKRHAAGPSSVTTTLQ